MSFGICDLDDLSSMSSAVRESITHPEYAGESARERAERKNREQLEENLRQSFKIVVLHGISWTLKDGSTLTAKAGQTLSAIGTKDGSFLVPYTDNDALAVEFRQARRTPFTPAELDARRRELQSLYTTAAQVQQLREQNRILDNIQYELERLE